MPTSDFKNMLVGIVNDPPLPSSALEYALDLALIFDAHVTIEVDATNEMPVGAMNYEAAFAVSEVNDRFERDAEAAVESVRAMALTRGVSCSVLSWKATQFALTHNFASLGRTHDLSVLDAGHDLGLLTASYAESALFETGRPVLIVPDGLTHCAFTLGVVAWDGSAEAASALNNALPLLRRLDAVEIVSVQKKDAEIDLTGISLHLHRHGIPVTTHKLPTSQSSTGEVLIAYAETTRPDLIVMGAYSHSRVREWILGGATRSMLKACPTALFLSH